MSIEVSRSKASAPSQVLITTKAVALTADSVTITIPAEKGKLVAEKRANASRQFEGLILIDGVKATSAEMASLGKDAIASVEVVKGPGARLESSDPAAEFGIIKITKKKPAP